MNATSRADEWGGIGFGGREEISNGDGEVILINQTARRQYVLVQFEIGQLTARGLRR